MVKKIVGSALALACSVACAQAVNSNHWVQIPYQSKSQLQAIASQFQHVQVDKKSQIISTEATDADIAAMRAAGFQVQIDPIVSEKIRQADLAMAASHDLKSISGFACYRTVEETYTSMDSMVSSYPDLAQVVDIGPTWERTRSAAKGYSMRVLKLTNKNTDVSIPDKANLVVLSSIHAREYTPAELMTRFAEWLTQNYGTNAEATYLLDNYRFHFLLQGNPDGRKKAETGLSWRKTTNTTNGSCSANSYGVDMNRNFPFHWNTVSGGSSPDPCVDTYHGPSAASEPEIANIVKYVLGTKGTSGAYSGGIFTDQRADALTSAAPDNYRGMFLDLHSFSQLVLYPWGDTSSAAPNSTTLRTLARRLAYFNGYSPEQSDTLYATDGASDDNAYGSLGVPAFTIELGVAFFENCTTFTSTTLPKNLAALKYAARSLEAPYQLPSGPDTVSVSTSAASVAQGNSVTVSASIDDSRFNQTNGTEATQTIASAKAYVDKLPWQSGAVAINLAATDGTFNATAEGVSGAINTAGLSLGRHFIYVQGTDASGKAGALNAAMITVTTSGGTNVAPVAGFSFATTGLVANFTDSSTDSDGSIASRSWNFGDGTSSTVASPTKTYAAAGTYNVSLSVTDNGGLSNSLTKAVTVSTASNVLSNNVAVTGLSAAKNAQLTYTMTVPAGATGLKFTTSGGTGDADLYARFGSAPTTTTFDCKSDGGTNTETCTIATAKAGTYYVMVRAFAAFSGLSLKGAYQ
jgi:carboxypeptidase T